MFFSTRLTRINVFGSLLHPKNSQQGLSTWLKNLSSCVGRTSSPLCGGLLLVCYSRESVFDRLSEKESHQLRKLLRYVCRVGQGVDKSSFFFFLSIVRWFRFSRAFSFIGVAWSGGTISRFQSWQSGGGEGLSSGVL